MHRGEVAAADGVAECSGDLLGKTRLGQLQRARSARELNRIGDPVEQGRGNFEVSRVTCDDLARWRIEHAQPSINTQHGLPGAFRCGKLCSGPAPALATFW